MTPYIFNRLESAGEGGIITSDVGPNATILRGANFIPFVFNNGMQCNDNEGIKFDISSFNFNKFTIDFYLSTDYAVVDGTSDVDFREVFTVDNKIWMYLYTQSSGIKCGWDINLGGVNVSYYGLTPSWSANTKHHHKIVFNKDGIDGGSDRLRYYLDDVLIGSFTTPHSGNQTSPYVHFHFGSNQGVSNEGLAPYTLDSFLLWADEFLDLDSRFWEDEGRDLFCSQGTYTDKVSLSWGAVAGESVTYMVSRSDSFDGSYTDIGTWQSGLTFDDTTAVPGTHYFYQVRTSTISSCGIEGWKQGTPPPTIPVPGNFSASAGTYIDKVSLSWDEVTVGTDAIQYQVFRSETSGGSYTDLSGLIDGLTFNDTTAVPGTHYFYKVWAYDVTLDLYSDLSTYEEGWAKVLVPPDSPSGVAATQGTHNSDIEITWDEVTVDSDTIKYMVYRSANSGGTFTAVSCLVSDLFFVDVHVVPGTPYFYEVKSFDVDIGLSSGYSSEVEGWAKFTASPPAVTVNPTEIVQIKDYDYNLNLLLEQYKKTVNLKGILSAMNSLAEDLESALFEIRDNFWINTAVGAQLDVYGLIFNVKRSGMSDSDYRAAIKARISLFKNFDPESIIEILIAIYQATYVNYFTDFPVTPAAYYMDTDAVITSKLMEFFSPSGVQPYLVDFIIDGEGNFLVDANGNKIFGVE